MLFPVGLAVAQFAAGPSPAAAFQDPGATIPTPGVTTPTTISSTTSVVSSGTVVSVHPTPGPIVNATSLTQIQSSTEYNQSEHEDILRLYDSKLCPALPDGSEHSPGCLPILCLMEIFSGAGHILRRSCFHPAQRGGT